MRINPSDLQALQSTYITMLESTDAPAAQPSESKQLKHKLLQNWKNLVLGAASRGELSEGLAARNIDAIIEQMWQDTQPILDHTWKKAQEAYEDMAADYEQELT